MNNLIPTISHYAEIMPPAARGIMGMMGMPNALEKHSDKPSEKHSDKPSEKHSEKHSDKYSDKPSEKHSDKYSEKHSEKHSEKLVVVVVVVIAERLYCTLPVPVIVIEI